MSANRTEEMVTYVVVVHGVGEQRKNETAIAVASRFAEARRDAPENDRRDMLTLGAVSRQTGTSIDPATLRENEQPWMEFEGIPSAAPQDGLGPFLGQASFTGKNLRFVDICWSDVLCAAYKEAGQPVEVWARGLLGRLLRKHEGADNCPCAGTGVPYWIRRTLYLLADGLLLTRKAMRFRFKEMEELVFTKFLGDVQIYGEYGRCRGRAVRRFHDMMARIEDAHKNAEKSNGTCREARYVVISHSLGTVMSFDALMYASAEADVRNGKVRCWEFPGYDDSSSEEESSPPSIEWIRRVASFVTLGSPIDKYLMVWWMNYRYLCTAQHLENPNDDKIPHFNYCDELDPVGHHLEVVSGTEGYKAVFKECEDIVFNRYGVPGVAHNEYWEDQALWRWILARSVDGLSKCASVPEPVWFDKKKYRQLLRWLYFRVPLAAVGFGGAALTLALAVSSWQTAVSAAAAFAVVLYLGRRLIDLAVWWRQIQRQEGKAARQRRSAREGENQKEREERKKAARSFRRWARLWPFAMCLPGTAGAWLTTSDWLSDGADVLGHALKGALIAAVAVAVLVFISRGRLPSAYRTPASGEDGPGAEWVAGLFGIVPLALGVVAGFVWPCPVLNKLPAVVSGGVANLTILAALASAVWGYRWRRFRIAKVAVESERGNVCYVKYAAHSGDTSAVDE